MLKSFLPCFSKSLRDSRILTTPLNSACKKPKKTNEISMKTVKKLHFFAQYKRGMRFADRVVPNQ